MPVTLARGRLGTFDTLLVLGNAFGLFGGPARARRWLKRYAALSNDGARIIAGVSIPPAWSITSAIGQRTGQPVTFGCASGPGSTSDRGSTTLWFPGKKCKTQFQAQAGRWNVSWIRILVST